MNKNKKNSWYSKQTLAQNARLGDLVDWVDDDTMNDATEVLSPQVVDFDELERQRALESPLEQGELPYIGEEEVDSYLVDDLIEQDENVLTDDEVEEGYFDGNYVPSEDELQEMGIEPVEDTGEVVDENPDDVPEFGADHASALQWAIENNRVVKLSYLTLGQKRGRGGKQYLKREITDDRIPGTGRNIWRIVEPHHIFSAKNGHDVLVTYDRSVRHIRAFRLENVTDVDFVKKRMTNEASYFKPRVKIKSPGRLDQSGKIKGIEAMNVNIFQNLKSIGDDLEGKGLSKTASVITTTMSNLLNIKTAQYVGPQGYWIRQKRCWDNCYRQKRTTAPQKAAQVVWTECWEEYNQAINNLDSGWEKYAQEDANLFKYASDEQKDWVSVEHKKFAKAVEDKLIADETQGMAIYHTLDEKQNEYKDTLLADADNLSKLAEQLRENGQEELSQKLANASVELLKEAQSPFGGSGFGNIVNKARQFNPFSAKSRQKGKTGDIQARLKNITKKALQFATYFENAKQYSSRWNMNQANVYNYSKSIKLAAPGDVPTAPAAAPAPVAAPAQVQPAQQPNPKQQKWMNALQAQLKTFTSDLQEEATNLSDFANTITDPNEQQKAYQASQRIMKFLNEVSTVQSQIQTPNFLETQGPQIGNQFRTFANDVNVMQMGGFADTGADIGEASQYADPNANPDGDEFLNKDDADRNNDKIIDNPEAMQQEEVPAQTTDLLQLKDLDKENIRPILRSLIDGGQITVEQINNLEKAFRSFRTSKPKDYGF
jgi:hypothetical protein